MFHQSSQTPLHFINSVFGPWNVGNPNLETLSIATMDFWVEFYNKSRSECKNDNNTEGMVCFKRILTLSNPRLRESNKPASVWAVSAMAWMFLCRQKIKKRNESPWRITHLWLRLPATYCEIGRRRSVPKLGKEKWRQMDKTERWQEPWPALCRLRVTYFILLSIFPSLLVPALCPVLCGASFM